MRLTGERLTAAVYIYTTSREVERITAQRSVISTSAYLSWALRKIIIGSCIRAFFLLLNSSHVQQRVGEGYRDGKRAATFQYAVSHHLCTYMYMCVPIWCYRSLAFVAGVVRWYILILIGISTISLLLQMGLSRPSKYLMLELIEITFFFFLHFI